ncbi:MAG: hypothetical protein K8T26_17470 [Lentisphaerae bacterium]|nr:hypothetical protein [Lentisphaerota bacterium]
MQRFPRTVVGGVSLSRLIIGSNWFLGCSHATAAKDAFIKETIADRKKIADIIAVYLRSGVDTIMGKIATPVLAEGIAEAQDRTGVGCIIVSTPHFPVTPQVPERGFNLAEVDQILELEVKLGATFCMPHQAVTDALVDRCTRKIRWMEQLCARIRECGMIPGLSTHMPETMVYADEQGLDVETYISIYNSMGFLMQAEVDWTCQLIRKAGKPVMTIKPMAAGMLRPLQGLTYVWNTIRPQDMVTAGAMTPREAEELIEISMSILDRRPADVVLQETRSKASIKPAAAV